MSVYETKPTQKNQLPKSLLPYALKSDAINKMTFASLSQGFIKEGLKYKLYLGMFLLITQGIHIYLVFFSFLKCLQTQ